MDTHYKYQKRVNLVGKIAIYIYTYTYERGPPQSVRTIISNLTGLLTVTLAKFFTFSLITWMPRSSDAFNSRTRDFISCGLEKKRQLSVCVGTAGRTNG